jgi:amidophosphoribosyltransferase
MDATYVREIEPGEILVIDDTGVTSHQPFPRQPPRRCIFEYVYFARPTAGSSAGRSIRCASSSDDSSRARPASMPTW